MIPLVYWLFLLNWFVASYVTLTPINHLVLIVGLSLHGALKETADLICIPLSILYSRSLDTGVLPDGCMEEESCMTSIYKQGRWLQLLVLTIISQLHWLMFLIIWSGIVFFLLNSMGLPLHGKSCISVNHCHGPLVTNIQQWLQYTDIILFQF